MNVNKRPTIKEVAKAAGISIQTVSRVINERPDVAPGTRERVLATIEELGYKPSALARSLIQQRSYTLGVVTAGLKDIGPSRILSGITAAAEEAGYSLLLRELPRYNTMDITPVFQALLSRHVDGIIWAVSQVGDNRKWVDHPLADIDVPLVYLTMERRENLTIVSIDNYLGGRMAMAHLLEQGYRKICHISGPMDWWEARQRMTAWKDALTEAGLCASDDHCVEGDWSSASGARATERLLAQYPEMDAIFVGNDQMALGAMKILSDKSVRIPEDIGIVGFDNIAESAFFSTPLTTVQQDQNNVARIAVVEIIKIIETGWQSLVPPAPKSIIVPPALVVRESSLRVLEGGDVKGTIW